MSVSIGKFLMFLLIGDILLLTVAGGHALAGSPSEAFGKLFSLESEATVPAWYASAKLLLLSGLLAVLSIVLGHDGRLDRVLLLGAAMFLAMSCDESAGIHERLQVVVEHHLLDPSVTAWAAGHDIYLRGVAVAVPVLVLAALIVRAIVRTMRSCASGKGMFLLGFTLLAAGAVVVDLTRDMLPLTSAGSIMGLILEETLELAGVSLMIFAALRTLRTSLVSVRIGPERLAVAAERIDGRNLVFVESPAIGRAA
jgi:hypothetical protein